MNSQLLLKFYVYFLLGIAILSSFYYFSHGSISWLSILPLILLGLIAERFKVKIFMYHTKESVAVSWSFVLSIGALISLGSTEAILVSAVPVLFASVYPKRLALIKLFYNVSSAIFTVIITSFVLNLVKSFVINIYDQPLISLFMSLFISLFYIFTNYFLATILMKLITAKSYSSILNDMIGPHVPHSVMLAFIGGILGVSYQQYGIPSLLFVLLLIGLIRYSLKSTAEAATKRIQELEESNKKTELLAQKLDQTFDEFIQTLTATIDARDPYMYGHSMQVSNYALALASELKLEEKEIERIRIAGLLHDIGKISIPESILFKEGRLTNEEYGIIKQHAAIGEEIVEQISSLSDVAKLVGMHHERYDGKGYPRGLKAEETPLGAHILAVSDTLDTMLSHRSYKRGRSIQEALDEFERCKGTQFHPDVVDALVNLRTTLGDDVFKNSAQLIDQAKIVGKVKTRTKILDLTDSA
jgi:putative nucleotidyltransferase with HDIG domain